MERRPLARTQAEGTTDPRRPRAAPPPGLQVRPTHGNASRRMAHLRRCDVPWRDSNGPAARWSFEARCPRVAATLSASD